MTIAASLAELVAWLAASSAPRRSPLGYATPVGPFAVMVSVVDWSEPPIAGFDPAALPLYVPTQQVAGLALPPIDYGAPASQPSPWDRAFSIVWRVREGTLPPIAIVGINDPGAPLSAALDASIDLDAVPALAVPVWRFTPVERAELRLPLLP